MPVNNIIEGTASGVVLDVDTTVVGNVGGGEDDLIVSTIPANTLDVDHKYIHFSASGRFATSINNKQLRAYFGSTKIFDSGSLAITSVSDWILEGWIIRISATSEHALVKFESSSSVLLADAAYSTPAEDLTNQVILKCTGAGTSDNDITQTDLIVDVNNGGTGLGDVSGPSSSVDGHFASFNGTTGKVIKDGTQPTTLANDLLWSAKGQLVVGVGSATGTILSVGAYDTVLTVVSGSTAGIDWRVPSGGGGGAPTTTPYITTASDATLSAEIVIPGLAGDSDIAGSAGAGVSYEFDSGSSPLTWNIAPTTEDVNTTIKSHLYIVANNASELLGTYSWSPAGAFDIRMKVKLGTSVADTTPMNCCLFVGDSSLANRVLVQLVNAGAGAFKTRMFTYASSAYTQRGVDHAVNDYCYLRITRDGSNNCAAYWSTDGNVWIFIATVSFTFTAAKAGLRTGGVTTTAYSAIDWIRSDV